MARLLLSCCCVAATVRGMISVRMTAHNLWATSRNIQTADMFRLITRQMPRGQTQFDDHIRYCDGTKRSGY
jgi:hypothetical protein